MGDSCSALQTELPPSEGSSLLALLPCLELLCTNMLSDTASTCPSTFTVVESTTWVFRERRKIIIIIKKPKKTQPGKWFNSKFSLLRINYSVRPNPCFCKMAAAPAGVCKKGRKKCSQPWFSALIAFNTASCGLCHGPAGWKLHENRTRGHAWL